MVVVLPAPFGPRRPKHSPRATSNVTSFRPVSPEGNVFETPRMFCDVYCLAPGQAQAAHSHRDGDKVYYVLEGAGKIVVDGEDVELKPGRYVLVSADAKRKIHPGDEGLRLIIVGSPAGAYAPRQG